MDIRFRVYTPHDFNKNHFSDIITLPYPMLVNLPNGYKVKVTEVGTVKLAPMITLYKVLFIPSFRYNLISINSFTIHVKCIASFSNSTCVLQGPSMIGHWNLVELKMDSTFFAQHIYRRNALLPINVLPLMIVKYVVCVILIHVPILLYQM